MIFRRRFAGSMLNRWQRLVPSTHSSPGPKKVVLSIFLSSLLSSFRASRLVAAWIGDGIRRPPIISFGGDFEERLLKYTKSDLQSDEAIWSLYERWCLHYEIHRSRYAMERRFPTFKAAALRVYEINNLQLCNSCALNPLADLIYKTGPHQWIEWDESDDEQVPAGKPITDGSLLTEEPDSKHK